MAADLGSQRDRICFTFNVDPCGLLVTDDGGSNDFNGLNGTTPTNREYGFVNKAAQLMITEHYGRDTWKTISENNRVDDALPFIDGMLYDDAVTNTIIDQCSVITGRSKSEIYELFGSMFYEFCEHAGYKEMYNTLSNNLCEFLQGLNTLNHHVTNKYPAVRLPLFQVSPDHDESLRVSCHTTRLHFEHVLIGMIREVAKRLHNIDVAITMTQPDEPLPNRIQLKVQAPSGVSPSIITNTLNHNVDVLNTDAKINPTTLCQLFPFHIMFDSRLKIVQAGVAVSRVIKEIDNQMLSFRDIFQFVDPDIDCTYDEILAHTQSIFVVRVRDRIRLSPRRSIGDKTTSSTVGSPLQQSPLLGGRRLGHDINDDEHKKRMRLKGQMLPLEDKEHVIFLCSANVHDLDELLERGLYLGDVPLHDSTRDLILLNEQFRAENDLAHKLEQVTETLQQTYRDLEAEKQLTDKLVYSILPPTVANKLRLNQPVEAVKYNCVTILFSGICDFDWFYSNNSPMKVVYLLNELYTKFDHLVKTNEADVYKVETVGDKYMLASGLPEKTEVHAKNIALVALDMMDIAQGVVVDDYRVKIIIGIHSGDVVAGVVGHKLPHYAVFGSTVCVASRMESTGEAGSINMSEATYSSLQTPEARDVSFCFRDRGLIHIKGLKAPMRCYFLSRKST